MANSIQLQTAPTAEQREIGGVNQPEQKRHELGMDNRGFDREVEAMFVAPGCQFGECLINTDGRSNPACHCGESSPGAGESRNRVTMKNWSPCKSWTLGLTILLLSVWVVTYVTLRQIHVL